MNNLKPLTCPYCQETRMVTGATFSQVRKGIQTARCKRCWRSHQAAAEPKRKTHTATCPCCGGTRIVKASIACQIRKGRKKGYCEICAGAYRKTNKNSGQFAKGHVPSNAILTAEGKEDQQNRRRIYKLKWRIENSEHVRNYFTKYHHEHIEKRKASLRNSRMKRKGFEYFPVGVLNELILTHTVNGAICCYICGSDCEGKWEVDHVIPISKGGTHDIFNLAIACRMCNRRKHTKSLKEYFSDVVSIQNIHN